MKLALAFVASRGGQKNKVPYRSIGLCRTTFTITYTPIELSVKVNKEIENNIKYCLIGIRFWFIEFHGVFLSFRSWDLRITIIVKLKNKRQSEGMPCTIRKPNIVHSLSVSVANCIPVIPSSDVNATLELDFHTWRGPYFVT